MSENPKKIDHYEVIRKIGSGGMGFVYLCRDVEIGRIVALKVMREDMTRKVRDSDRLRFIREALTTARLQHPGIPPVFCVRRSSEGQLYYAMKLIEGHSLDEILKGLEQEKPEFEKNYNINRCVTILRDLCRCLSYAHAQGFLHRDLKPANIFVGDFGEVYLIDWGLTKRFGEDQDFEISEESNFMNSDLSEDSLLIDDLDLDDETEMLIVNHPSSLLDDAPPEDQQLTLQGDLVGTPSYMPPENTYRSPPEPAPSADIYSVGVLLYRVLTLKLPIPAKGLKDLVKAKREGLIVHPDDNAPDRDIPPELAAIAMQSMSTQPEDRYASIQELGQSLEFWLEGKTQFRRVDTKVLSKDMFLSRPSSRSSRWQIKDNAIRSLPDGHQQLSRLFFRRSFYGDVRLSLNLRVLSSEDNQSGPRNFGILFMCDDPNGSKAAIDHYALNFVGGDTRLELRRNGNQIASNENIILEPDKKYHIVIECSRGEIKVTVNARMAISCLDRSPLAGAWLGFLDQGQPVIYSRITIMTCGLPIKTETMNIPEALMAEGCFEAAQRFFLEIYRNHRFRYMGNKAAYRAGIAAYRATGSRSEAIEIWSQLRHSRYRALEQLGLARIDLLNNQPVKASEHIKEIIESKPPMVLLRDVADFAQEHTQKLLDHGSINKSYPWPTLETWTRITLSLDQKLRRRDPITLSLLWHWLSRVLQSDPLSIKKALSFIRKTYGEGRGEFLELITNQEQLVLAVRRSQTMGNHSFLIEKLMRLMIWHDDPIDDLETLGRFYLNSGHERIALQIFQQLMKICLNNKKPIPPAPCAYVGTYLWLHGEEDKARRAFKIMERNSTRWGPSDAHFFLGLDDYRLGKRLNAVQRWKSVCDAKNDPKTFRKLIAKALLGELPPCPDQAGLPERHDYHLMFYFFLGLRYFIDWRESKDEKARSMSIELFNKMQKLMKPSYDIYASTQSFVRIPLMALKAKLKPIEKPEILSQQEKNWLKSLILSVKNEMRSSAP